MYTRNLTITSSLFLDEKIQSVKKVLSGKISEISLKIQQLKGDTPREQQQQQQHPEKQTLQQQLQQQQQQQKQQPQQQKPLPENKGSPSSLTNALIQQAKLIALQAVNGMQSEWR